MISTVGPVFKHDCDCCEYLGHYEEHDLYYCKDNMIPTVSARWSGTGQDYASGIAIAEAAGFIQLEAEGDKCPSWARALRVAYLIAKDLGRELHDPAPPVSLR